MTDTDIAALFTRADGGYHFARWNRPIAPVVFGVEDAMLAPVKAAFRAVIDLAGHQMGDIDPEIGANLMVFFIRNWDELQDVPDLDRILPDLDTLVGRLSSTDANQYRVFRFDRTGAIRAAFVFLCMDRHLSSLPVGTIALSQAVGTILLWSDGAFARTSPLVKSDGAAMVRPEISAVIRAAYDPVLPAVSQDPSHALRLAARLPRFV